MRNNPPHTVSVDEIVGRLLQLWRADSPITLSDKPPEVMMGLQFSKEETEIRLAHAKHQASPGPDTGELQHKLDTINKYLTIGKRLEAALINGIEARRQGKDTGVFTIVLRAEENDPDQYEEGYFTTKCIYDWAQEEFGLEVPEWLPAQRSTEANTVESPPSGAKAPRYTDLDKEKHEVIIALLLEELAYHLKGKFLENGVPNCTQLGERIAEKCAAQKVDINGVSSETLRRRFGEVIKVKERCMPAGN